MVKKRFKQSQNNFLGLPSIHLIVILALIIVLLAWPSNYTSVSNKVNEKIQVNGITSNVVKSINFNKTSYNVNEDLKGNVNLVFYPKDLIPEDSDVTFSIGSVKCNYFYVCENGTIIKWEIYNPTTKQCEAVINNSYPYPYRACGEMPPVVPTVKCTSMNKVCCEAGTGIGGFYSNLICQSNQECWDSCSSKINYLLKGIINESITPGAGNYTYGLFKDVNSSWPGEIQISGQGFGGCILNVNPPQNNENSDVAPSNGGFFNRLFGNSIFSPSPPKTASDLTITKIEKTQLNNQVGVKITMKNIGTGSTLIESFILRVTYDFNLGVPSPIPVLPIIKDYRIQQQLSPGSEASYVTSDVDVTGKKVLVTAFVDALNNEDESDEKNNVLSSTLSEYACGGWDNVYVVPLEKIGLKSPAVSGNFKLFFDLSYHESLINSNSALFDVTLAPLTHKACRNNQCISINEPGSDSCEKNSDCSGGGGGCTENWQYTGWSLCDQGEQERDCFDLKSCGTVKQKPTSCININGVYKEIRNCCIANWNCDDWGACFDDNGNIMQTRHCEEINHCSENTSYDQTRECCQEDWNCEWSSCANGKMQMICQDKNNCGTSFNKPQTEPELRMCSPSVLPLGVWIIIAVIIVVILLYFLVIRKKRVDYSYQHFTKN